MIQPLRTVHRRAFAALAIVLPAVLVAGLGARRPRMASSGQVLQLPSSTHLVKQSDTLWKKHTMQTSFYSDSNHSDIQVALHPAQDFNEPDLLVYWSVERPTGDSLPASAQLIGPFIANKVFTLPPDINRTGYLILFSLAHESVFDSAQVESLP